MGLLSALNLPTPRNQPAPPNANAAPPTAKPDAKPAAQRKMTIVNNAGFDLRHASQTLLNNRSKFNPAPPSRVGAGRTGQFAVEVPDPQFPQTSGSVRYAFTIVSNDPASADEEFELSLEWQESALATGVPNGAKGVRADTNGDLQNTVYTITGPALEFKPPEKKVKQPTLRFGDKSADGWVEYLQELLNHQNNAGLEVDGDFKGETLKAVNAFQRKYKKEGVLEDGIVGDQTWSYLREGAPEKPKTDGRKAHSYVEKGVEARWLKEKEDVWYDDGIDTVYAQLISVGDVTQIEGRKARFRIMHPDGDQKVVDGEIGKGFPYSKTDQGHQHNVPLPEFSLLFEGNPKGKPKPGRYVINAYFPGDLGGDDYTGVLTITGAAPAPAP